MASLRVKTDIRHLYSLSQDTSPDDLHSPDHERARLHCERCDVRALRECRLSVLGMCTGGVRLSELFIANVLLLVRLHVGAVYLRDLGLVVALSVFRGCTGYTSLESRTDEFKTCKRVGD